MPEGTIRAACRFVMNCAGVDRAVALTVLGRLWSSFAGLVSLVVVGHFLSPSEQGYFYTFGSLLALQVFAEMGLTNVILQFASHEAAHLVITPNGIAAGPPEVRSRLASVLRFALRWYLVAAAGFILIFLPAGWFFFENFSSGGADVSWQVPWVCTVLASTAVLIITPIPAFLEGCGMVADVARYRLIQAVAANAALWGALLSGVGLASAPVFAAVNLAIMLAWLATKYRNLIQSLLTTDGRTAICFRNEIWPFQWRIALSWMSGYFLFQFFTPLVFAFDGPVVAGRMGMSLTLAAAVSSIGLSWLSTKAPRFGVLISRRQFLELDDLFFRSFKQAIVVSVVCACAVTAIVALGSAVHHPLADRILPPWPLACFALASIANVSVAAEATYLRAFKREPLLLLSVLNAGLNVLSALVFAGAGSTLPLAMGYLAIGIVVACAGTWIFYAKRQLWQLELRDTDRADQPPMQLPLSPAA